jgi:hypothetical protein
LSLTKALSRSVAIRLGPVRRVIEQRDALLAERDALAAQVADLLEINLALTRRLDDEWQAPAPVVQILNPPGAGVPAATPYEAWFQATFGVHGTAPNTFPATSWALSDRWGTLVNDKMVEVEEAYAETLLREIEADGVAGAIVEFGVFRGDWLLRLIRSSERLRMRRQFFGFDSFAGLPAPSSEHDLDCWAAGDYAASLEEVAEHLDVTHRANVTLVKGWFSDSLRAEPVAAIDKIALARIDCDLYQPAVECLDYLEGRLTDGAILVFDDWTFDLAKGETKAFAEWVERVSGFRFEFLCFNSIGHVYIRIHHAR